MNDIRFVIITGLSGAGKTQAVRSLEDLGFFCVDNLPPALIPKFAELCAQSSGDSVRRVALVIDIRGGEFFDDLAEALKGLEEVGLPYEILFLEANDEVLVRRYKETRRRHPLAPQGNILEGIKAERKKLEEIKGKANVIIDTSDLTPQRLREEILQIFSTEKERRRIIITVVTFGFKHGLPLDADLVFDVRFLPNPHYVESLRPLTGERDEVKEYVLKWPVTKKFMRRLNSLIRFLLPHYINEGKTQLNIAVGCTGGQHRSVVVAEELANALRGEGNTVVVEHRDIDKWLTAGQGKE
ncbi:MAG: RNase adapter RapZ [Firmicutes bacterium]|nr:RNase adapter RapZ [Bacillota bacterium]